MWQKKVPSESGWYWCNIGQDVVICYIYTFTNPGKLEFDKNNCAKQDIHINIFEFGTVYIHKGKTEEESRKVFGWQNVSFWDKPLEAPAL